MKLTNKDLLLVVGIIVAMIITLTTLVFKDALSPKTTENEVTPKALISPSALIDKVADRVHSTIRPASKL